MRAFAPNTGLIDLQFQGYPEYIACYVLEAGPELLVVDPGPSSTLPVLERGLRLAGHSSEAVTGILLTHIHLDHAGCTGSLVARHPHLRVYVHTRGARHLVDPSRLLASATRLYGDRMESLWGAVSPVPEARIIALDGGEELRLGTRRLSVHATPGHAIHHVSYYEAETGIAWVGDTLGIRIDNRPYVLPVTPPPDVDLDAWQESLQLIAGWNPSVLCPTHFGPARPAGAHIVEFESRLQEWAKIVQAEIADPACDDSAAATRFRRHVAEELTAALGPQDCERYLRGGGVRDSWHGLARYFRKLGSKPTAAA